MNAKKWVLTFLLLALVLVLGLAAFNYVTDPFAAFGDKFLNWFSYDETNNPRVAKISYLEQHHDEYDSYILGCSSTSSLQVSDFNKLYDANFYNLIMYGADMRDCEKIADYLIEHYEVKHLVLNVYLDNGFTYDDETDRLTRNLHYLTDPDTSALSFYTRYLFCDPRYGFAKLKNLRNDRLLPQSFDVFNEVTGEYDKRVRDVEPIGSMDTYLEAYPVFADYPKTGDFVLGQTENCMKSVAAIKERCEAADVELVVVAAPVYIDYFQNFQAEDVANFYASLAKATDFWDFSCSSVSCEPRYFYDATHFRNAVGSMIAARIAGDDSVYIPDDFGTYVTADTPSSYFSEVLQATALPDETVSRDVPVLMWHNLAEESSGDMTISVDTFRAQIEALHEAGFRTVSLQQLYDYVHFGTELPGKPIVLTFDDGYFSNYEYAFPILQEYDMQATIFAIGVSVGKDTYKDTDHAMTPHFGADEAREMVASGLISVQSHTYDMHQWPPFEDGNAQVRETLLPFDGEADADYEAAVEADFAESRELLESITGQPVNALAFPEGAYVTLTQDALRSAGAELTFTTVRAVNTVVKGLPQSLCAMPRFGMTESTDMTALVAELEQ
ncbi:MAG: polysaccharide deacetylase family protein [Oscillospiraceae bacterium]